MPSILLNTCLNSRCFHIETVPVLSKHIACTSNPCKPIKTKSPSLQSLQIFTKDLFSSEYFCTWNVLQIVLFQIFTHLCKIFYILTILIPISLLCPSACPPPKSYSFLWPTESNLCCPTLHLKIYETFLVIFTAKFFLGGKENCILSFWRSIVGAWKQVRHLWFIGL